MFCMHEKFIQHVNDVRAHPWGVQMTLQITTFFFETFLRSKTELLVNKRHPSLSPLNPLVPYVEVYGNLEYRIVCLKNYLSHPR